MSDSKYANDLAYKAMMLCRLGMNLNNAMNICNQALEIDKRCVDAWIVGAAIFYRIGNYEQALKYCKNAIDLQPNHTRALQSLAEVEKKIREKK